jgi:ketosteroid isomerase-like protein
MKGVQLDGQARIEELQVMGDWAYLRSYIEITLTPLSGTAVRRSGFTLTILRKETDGQWRLARDANLVM